MVIGIKYMTGSIEEKANYKKSMIPYIVGCVLLFAGSTLAPKMTEILEELTKANNIESTGNIILGIIRVVGTVIAVGALMLLGIKYMMGTSEEKASYKKSMLPYAIGAVLLFAGVNITSAIYDTIDTINTGEKTYTENFDKGKHDAEFFYKQGGLEGTETAGLNDMYRDLWRSFYISDGKLENKSVSPDPGMASKYKAQIEGMEAFYAENGLELPTQPSPEDFSS